MTAKKGASKKNSQRKSKKLGVKRQTIKDLDSKRSRDVKGGGIKPPEQCNMTCDSGLKTNFASVKLDDVLNRLSGIPIETWNYTWDDPSVRHISPMAQDFAAAFSVGEDDKHIHPVDVSGVAFASIQALYQMLKESRAEILSLRNQVRKLQKH